MLPSSYQHYFNLIRVHLQSAALHRSRLSQALGKLGGRALTDVREIIELDILCLS